jgi:dihydrofolate reductase/thymidylate synthase
MSSTDANATTAMQLPDFSIVVAATPKSGIGNAGTVPWSLPGDMAFFKKKTTTTKDENKQNVVIMGRKTWESIPVKYQPLPQRINVVLSGNAETRAKLAQTPNVFAAESLTAALAMLSSAPALADKWEKVFVIGGAAAYNEAMKMPQCKRLHWTIVNSDVECDTSIDGVDAQVGSIARSLLSITRSLLSVNHHLPSCLSIGSITRSLLSVNHHLPSCLSIGSIARSLL